MVIETSGTDVANLGGVTKEQQDDQHSSNGRGLDLSWPFTLSGLIFWQPLRKRARIVQRWE
jgi:hypothetical protein